MLSLILFLPGSIKDVLEGTPKLGEDLRRELGTFVRKPTPGGVRKILAPIAETIWNRRSFPSLLDYLPTGLFDNSSIERYMRRNMKQAGMTNDFRRLYRRSGRELYISAMNLILIGRSGRRSSWSGVKDRSA